ncbi:ribokinase [Halothermothrix orenii]|uniref:Ribokinase n=1 Tax=Halothermothrix orenii (strain H 168 / OCM 544 / DSM 9562) TaxID=373903 RepID=B8D1Y9_HALOH|nr:ribokinase [Halothermothrix orenii]ACL69216.1 Ribokinase [Halothermothrix orenii H 168]
MTKEILVIGSLNMDLIVQTEKYPRKGETVPGENFKQVPGGKGANQALTAGKLGGQVRFIGSCGKDEYGTTLLNNLKNGGVIVDDILRVEKNTGIAMITIEKEGSNRIIYVKGANEYVTPDVVMKMEDRFKKASILLIQMEIPLESVIKAVELAKKYQMKVILDPSPVQGLPEKIFPLIDYILPNEIELDELVKNGCQIEEEKAKHLLKLGTNNVIVTKGKNGVSHYYEDKVATYESYHVKAVDTTAAGDAFAGSLAYGLSQGWSLEKTIKFSNLVAANSVTKLGAQSSLPTYQEVMKFAKHIKKNI